MIKNVSLAEDFIKSKGISNLPEEEHTGYDPIKLAQLRKEISQQGGTTVLARLNPSKQSTAFSKMPGLDDICSRGPLTPDHIIRTKQKPLVFNGDASKDVTDYVSCLLYTSRCV